VTTFLDSLDPVKVAQLPAGQRAVLARVLDMETRLSDPATFATACSYGQWLPYRHLVHTSERIVAMIEQDTCDCLIVEQPVRHGKSELCSRWTPAWYILRHGGRVGLASYEADFAETHSRRAREIVSEWGGEFGVQIDNRSKAAHRWDIEHSRAGMWAAGAGGPITGKGADLLIVDDPIKNGEDAASAVMREHLWEWWRSTFLTRRDTPKAKVIVIMSRWHTDDLVARILAATQGMRVERLRLPALAEENDVLGRRPGDALCPERFDERSLELTRMDIGPGPWAALYQQRPTLAGGAMFRRPFNYWTKLTKGDETYNILGDHTVDDSMCWRFITMDPAYTTRKRSDYTAAATWAVTPTDPPNLLLLDLRRVRVESAEHARLIESMWDTWSPSWVGIEHQAATLSLFHEAQVRGVVVRWLKPDRNKLARAETAVALMEAGRIWFPRDAVWLPDFEDELLSFPVGAHDDQVDVLAYAAIELMNGVLRGRRLHKEPETIFERHWASIKKRDRDRRHPCHPVIGRF
jgi:predicted phage terminase large subunit-like protein